MKLKNIGVKLLPNGVNQTSRANQPTKCETTKNGMKTRQCVNLEIMG
jgi:hypothetical protein